MSQAPPAYLALDLWMALKLPVEKFNGYYDRNGWATTWSVLLAAVRGPAICGAFVDAFVDGEICVLAPHKIGPHMGSSDVGGTEPLPFIEKESVA